MTEISTELKAAVFDRLVAHLGTRADVQNLDLMNLAGFCRNCLSNWLVDAAAASGTVLDKNAARAEIYRMPYETWKALYQREASAQVAQSAVAQASPEQLAKFKAAAHQD